MNSGKVSQRILTFMEKRDMDIQGLGKAAGLDPDFIDTMLKEDVYPPPGPFDENCPGPGGQAGHLFR